MESSTPARYRQSLISTFDSCHLRARFSMEDERRTPSVLAARGTLFHRFVHYAVKKMMESGERTYPVDMAMNDLANYILPQVDVPSEETVPITMEQMKWLRALVTIWCENARIDARRTLAAEERFYADLKLPSGEVVQVTGQLDHLITDPPNGLVVIDYKAQPLDAKVLTPTGWRPIGDLWIGDQVIGSGGTPIRVLGVYPQGKKEVFEVEFTDGSKTRCCDDHLWSVTRNDKTVVKPLREIRNGCGGWRMPVIQPVRFTPEPDDLPIDPYLLGLLLGDGNLRVASTPRLATADREIVVSVSESLPSGMVATPSGRFGLQLVREGSRRESLLGNRNPLTAALDGLGLLGKKSYDKFVPKRYLYASPGARLAVLRGLMDTDGGISLDGKVGFRSSSLQLIEAVLFLVRSLGGRASWATWDYPDPYRRRYGVQFRIPVVPFKLPRKAQRWRPSHHTMSRYIRSVRSVGEAECVCIRVDAQDGLYTTDDFILTHNSGYGRPPEPRNVERAENEGTGLTALGWAQWLIYSYLLFECFPTVQRVIFREVHVMRWKEAYAKMERWEIERLRDVLVGQVSLLHRAVQEGPGSGVWTPTPGTHCAMCANPRGCPIREKVGIPSTYEEAQRLVQEWIVAGVVREDRLPLIKGWVDAYGDIEIRHARGRKVVGYQNPGSRSLSIFEPREAPKSPYDEFLAGAADKAGVLVER